MRRQHLARTLRQLRLARKMTLRELGDKTGLTQQYVQRLESGLQQPRFVVIEKLATALGVSIARFARPGLLERARRDPQLVRKVEVLRTLERMAALTETLEAAGAARGDG